MGRPRLKEREGRIISAHIPEDVFYNFKVVAAQNRLQIKQAMQVAIANFVADDNIPTQDASLAVRTQPRTQTKNLQVEVEEDTFWALELKAAKSRLRMQECVQLLAEHYIVTNSLASPSRPVMREQGIVEDKRADC